MISLPQFELIDEIGSGQFGKVYKARVISPPGKVQAKGDPSGPSPALAPAPSSLLVERNAKNPFADSALAAKTTTSRQPHPSNPSASHQKVEVASLATNIKPKPTDKYVAIKRIKIFELSNNQCRADCMKEVDILKTLKHPNIINYAYSFMQDNDLFIVLEYVNGGDLSKLIRYFQNKRGLLSESQVLKYFTQVCSAVHYIHSRRVLHRDIKPENIFMTSEGIVKLGDFGLGRFFSQNTRDAFSLVGTFYYMSPERLREIGYSFSSDVWSLGCVLYELMTLYSPFNIYADMEGHQHKANQQNPMDLTRLINRIDRAQYPSLDPYTSFSPRLRYLVTECLRPDPGARPDMKYICEVVNQAYLQAGH